MCVCVCACVNLKSGEQMKENYFPLGLSQFSQSLKAFKVLRKKEHEIRIAKVPTSFNHHAGSLI